MLLERQHLRKQGCLKSLGWEKRTAEPVLSEVEGMCAGVVG
jgi:hypothetical protein